MKHDLQLKIQAWVDGELSPREARRISELAARDAEAGQLAAALGAVKRSLELCEAPALPEAREFYWSKIERQIRAEERNGRAVAAASGVSWRRWLMPFAGAAALVCAGLIVHQEMRPPNFDDFSGDSDGMDAVTFHDQSAGMTVVWLQDRDAISTAKPQPAGTAAAPLSIPDPGESAEEVE